MFRKMRRARQELSKEECEKILLENKTGVLGVIGDGGYPYTVPLNFVYESGKIYFHCAKTGHKLDAIKNDPKVSFCVVDKDDVVKEKLTTYFKSVIVFGRARELTDDEEIYEAAEKLGLKYSDDLEYIKEEIERERKILSCVEISVEHMSGKQAKELMK
ncbi:MAG: pyridoxamine 5'-phosphate oxidase family protein [Clostridia bacterium]|nr:pyridoxamine 5'-phosphate oxidase family protein [Clostridia bacterium]